jgi:hypothetical protein
MHLASFSRARCAEDLASQALVLNGAHTIYADPETAGVLSGIIERAGGGGRITVRSHRWLLPGQAVAVRQKENGGAG